MINYKVCAFCLLSVILTSCSHKDVELPEIVQVKKVNPYHKVSEGETVGSVAAKYGMTRAELIKLNNLEPPYQLYNGQRLVVSVKPELEGKVGEPSGEKVPDVDSETQNTEVSVQTENTNSEENVVDSETQSQVAETSETGKDTEQIDEAPMKNSEYTWPIENGKSKISQHFNSEEVDGGIIIDASVGTPVKSIADGTVVISGVPSGEAAAYGTTVVIKHTAKKTMSIYANLKEAKVSVGKKVKQGEIIGKVGKSGSIAKKPQLYFELNDLSGPGRKAVDPEKFLSD